MLERLANTNQIESAARNIADLISAHAEWFVTQGSDNTEAVRRHELDLAVSHHRLILSSWTEKGTRSWSIASWEWNGNKLLLQTSRRMGRERPLLELIPRASAAAVAATVRAARQGRSAKLSALACSIQNGAK